MNWYRKAQQGEDPNQYWFPEADHDYNPAHDYDVNEIPDEEVVQIVNSYVEILKKQLLPKISDVIKGMKIGYIKGYEHGPRPIAAYANGTAPWPAILIDIEATKDAITKYGGDLADVIEMNITHELGHAIQEVMGLSFDEQQAEDFAFSYQFMRQIDRFWE